MTTNAFVLVNPILVFIPFLIGLFSFKKFITAIKLILFFVAAGVFTEIASSLMIKLQFQNTMPLSHLYGLISFLAIGLFYHHTLKGFIKTKWIDSVIILYSVYFVINSIFIQGIYEYPGIAKAIGTIFILLGSILFFARVMQEAKIKNLFAEPLIWINGALLIYYSSNLFFFVLFNILLDYSREFSKLTVVYLLGFNTLLYFLISVGFLKQRNYTNKN